MTPEADDFLSFENEPSAEAIAELLRRQGIPARVEVRAALPGLVGNVRIVVPEILQHRARWLLKFAEVSERELSFLATGNLENENEDGSK